jgi:hypothetical protein
MLATRQLERLVPVFAGFVPATAAACPLFASGAAGAVAEFGGAPQRALEEKTP